MIVPVQNGRATVSEERKEDIDELDRIEKCYFSGCSCQLAQGAPCCKSIQKSHYEEYRNICVEMTKQELDMVVMGQIVAFTNRSTKTLHHWHLTDKERERESSTFKHEGTQICLTSFLFLQTIGMKWYKNLKKHVREFGIVPRQHKFYNRQPHNAFTIEDRKIIVTFIINYAEQHGVSLPGKIPGFKRDDIKVLPCSQTKKYVWRLYKESLSTVSPVLRTAQYSLFCQTWATLVPHIVISKPMFDLCPVCYQNSKYISSAFNCSDEEKQKVKHFT